MHYYLQAHTEGMTKNAHEYLITLSSSFTKMNHPYALLMAAAEQITCLICG